MPVLAHTARRAFDEDGWLHLSRLVPPDLCRELDRALRDGVGRSEQPLMRVLTSREEVHERSAAGWITNPIIHPGRLPFPGVRGLESTVLASSEIVPLVAELLHGAPALLQSGWWESSVGTPLHRDRHPTDPDGAMLGVWIALEDIALEAGPFVALTGTHRPDANDPQFAEYLRVAEAAYQRQYVDLDASSALARRADTLLAQWIDDQGLQRVAFVLSAGDAVVWHKDVLHGSLRPAPGGPSRSSLVLHFVHQDTVDVAPLT